MNDLSNYDILAEARKVAEGYEAVQETLNKCLRCHDSTLTIEDRYGVCRQCVLES